eukprot:Awhi_evm1s14426
MQPSDCCFYDNISHDDLPIYGKRVKENPSSYLKTDVYRLQYLKMTLAKQIVKYSHRSSSRQK